MTNPRLAAARNQIMVCDPADLANMLKPNPDGSINVAIVSGEIGDALFAPIDVSASGTVVTAVANKIIRVIALQLIASNTVNVKWQTSTGSVDITGFAYLVANSGYVLPFNPAGWFETVVGDALDINLSVGVAVGGSMTYVEL